MGPIITSNLESLAEQISQNAALISDFLRKNNLPEPSFERDGPSTFPVPENESKIQMARWSLIEASKAIYDLAVGPSDMLGWSAMNHKYECASLRAIVEFRFAHAVPLDGEASFAAISAKTGQTEEFVSRIIRFATTSRIFTEHRPGFVSHTAASRVLATDEKLAGNIGHNLIDLFPGTAKLNEAAKLYDLADGEPNQTAFGLAHGTEKTFFEFVNESGQLERKERFHRSMQSWASGWSYSAEHIERGVDWDSFSGIVVDVGGSHGQISQVLARKHANLNFMVQDRPEVIKAAQEALPEDLEGRIFFVAHDFFSEQPVQAEAYILRWILHDWSDRYCEKILRKIQEAMKPTSRIVIMETILPGPNTVPTTQEKLMRSVDLQMIVACNSRERALEDWKALFGRVGLKLARVTTPPESALSVMEVVLCEPNRGRRPKDPVYENGISDLMS